MAEPSPGPRVSVVLPVYNGAAHIRDSVESILYQSWRDFELVIIDDGSTDDTWPILRGYAELDTRVVLLRNDHNRGLIFSLNRGLAAARGELVARQDADDVSRRDRLASQIAYLDAFPEVGVLGTDYYRLTADGARRRRRPPASHTEIRWRLLFGNVWCHASVMLRRACLEPQPYHSFKDAEDYELWTRLLQRYRGATMALPVLVYREHAESVSSSNRQAQARMTQQVSATEMGKLLPRADVTPEDAEALRRLYRAEGLVAEELDQIPILLQLMDAFARQDDVEAGTADRLRRRWIGRLLRNNGWAGWWRLCRFDSAYALLGTVPPSLAKGALNPLYRWARPRARGVIGIGLGVLRRLGRYLRRRGKRLKGALRRRLGSVPRSWSSELDGHPVMAQEYAGFTVLYSAGTSLISRLELARDLYEPALLARLRREIVRRHAVSCLDIGANIGLVSLALLRWFPDLHVYSFDPGPHQSWLLAGTIRRNQLGDRMEHYPVALAERNGTIDFYAHETEHVSGDGLFDTHRAGATHKIQVPALTVDEWWTQHEKPKIGIAKLDTEGSELLILRGARAFVDRCRPTLFLEINPKNLAVYPYGVEEIFIWLDIFGYSMADLRGREVPSSRYLRDRCRGDTFMAVPNELRHRTIDS